MTRSAIISILIAAGLAGIPESSALAAKFPRSPVLCLPPGGGKPVKCGAVEAGSTIQIVVKGRNPSVPLRVRLNDVSHGGKPAIGLATMSARMLPGSDGAYVLTVPRHLCRTAAKGQQLQFEIQMLTSEYNQAEKVRKASQADSLGWFQMRC